MRLENESITNLALTSGLSGSDLYVNGGLATDYPQTWCFHFYIVIPTPSIIFFLVSKSFPGNPMEEFVLEMYVRKSSACSCRIRWKLLCFGPAKAYLLDEVRRITFAVEVNLLAQCWFCTVCIKWDMAESINSEACQGFLYHLN